MSNLSRKVCTRSLETVKNARVIEVRDLEKGEGLNIAVAVSPDKQIELTVTRYVQGRGIVAFEGKLSYSAAHAYLGIISDALEEIEEDRTTSEDTVATSPVRLMGITAGMTAALALQSMYWAMTSVSIPTLFGVS